MTAKWPTPSPSKTGRAPAAARTVIGPFALPLAFQSTLCRVYVPPATSRVSPGLSFVAACSIVSHGFAAVPAARSSPSGARWYVVPTSGDTDGAGVADGVADGAAATLGDGDGAASARIQGVARPTPETRTRA